MCHRRTSCASMLYGVYLYRVGSVYNMRYMMRFVHTIAALEREIEKEDRLVADLDTMQDECPAGG